MSHSSWQQQQHHLDSLQGMVNAVLIETGKALRSANTNNVKTIGHTHGRIKAFLPTALDKFHLALDELETDIVRAQAVLSRDLGELRARKRELDNPTTRPEEDVASLNEANGVSEAKKSPGPEAVMLISVAELKDEVAPEDTFSNNVAVGSPEPKIEEPSEKLPTALDSAAQDQVLETTQKSADEHGATAPAVTNVTSQESKELDQTEGATDFDIDMPHQEPSALSEAPQSNAAQIDSFDSIYDIGTAADTDLNFDDFDFSTGHETHDYGQDDGDLDLSSFVNQETGSKNDDLDDLLPGLESYGDGNGNEDYHAFDLSNNTTTNEIGADQAGISTADDFGMSGGDLDMAMGMGNNESTFDDLLEGMGMSVDGEGTGEFDDAYFG